MSASNNTIPDTEDFVLVIQRIKGKEHVAMCVPNGVLVNAKDKNWHASQMVAGVRTAGLAIFDRVAKRDVAGNPHLGIADIAKVIDYDQEFIDKNGAACYLKIEEDKPAATVPGRDPAISTEPVKGPTV